MRATVAPSTRSDERRRREASLARGTSGAVYVEFLIAFLPFFIMVLGMTQTALMYMGHLVVQHAANIAARAAIVVIPDDPARYGDAPVGSVAAGAETSSEPSAIDRFIGLLGGDSGSSPSIPGLSGGEGGGGGSGGGSGGAGDPAAIYSHRNARMRAIAEAASIPLMSISPSIQQLAPQLFGQSDNVHAGLGSNNPMWRAIASLLYNRAAVAVTFPTAPGAAQYRNSFGRDDAITTRVTYLFHCGIPIARQIMCQDPISLRLGISPAEILAVVRGLGSNPSPATVAAAMVTLQGMVSAYRNPSTEVAELSTNPAFMAIMATFITGQRYVIMRGEATLPNQGADYAYQTGGAATPPPETPDSGCPRNFSGCCSHHTGMDSCHPDGTLHCLDGWVSGCRCNPDGTRACL